MTVRSVSFAGRLAGVLALVCLAACKPATDQDKAQQVRDAFGAFKDAFGARQAKRALDCLDQPSRHYLQSAATTPEISTAPDAEVRELVRQTVVKLTPGGVGPDFSLETPLQRVLDAGWINAQDLQGLDLGPVTFQGDQARAEVIWQGTPTTLNLFFVRESGVWKVDLLQLVSYAVIALRMDRTVKGQTESQQIARLVAQVPAL